MITRGAKEVFTRFRAYHLGEAGSCFSYFAGNHFTLIEARITDLNRKRLAQELSLCGRSNVDTLHITSWDNDHCGEADLQWLLEDLAPTRVEYPGYEPSTDCGRACLALILSYRVDAPLWAIE